MGDSHLDSDGWIEGLFKHEEFEEKERLITPWQTNGGQACKNAALLEKTDRSSPSSSSDSSSSGARIQRRVKKAQKVLERRDPAYRAWRDEERTREREKDLRRQDEALAAATASRWDDALRRCAIVPAGVPQAQSAPMGVGGAFQTFPPMPPPMAHLAEDEVAAPITVGWKLTRSQVGWLDLLFRGMISIPVDCTPEEVWRMISVR